MDYVEKYAPESFNDLILPGYLKEQLQEWKRKGEVPHLLLVSKVPGTGKSSLSKALIKELQTDGLFLNASLDSNIDTLRNTVSTFVKTRAFEGRKKIVVLDEADNLNSNSTQPALRGFIEAFQKNAKFILTANNPEKIIEPIKNRLFKIDFDILFTEHEKEIKKKIAQRLIEISKKEGKKIDKNSLKRIIKESYPSIRMAYTLLQKFHEVGDMAFEGGSYVEILSRIPGASFEELSQTAFMLSQRSPYTTMLNEAKKLDISDEIRYNLITRLAEYAYRDSSVPDRELNLLACLLEVKEILK